MKKKLGQLFMVVSYLVGMGYATAMSIYRAIPANGWSDFDRGSYVTMAPLFGLFFLMGIGAAIGLVDEWRST